MTPSTKYLSIEEAMAGIGNNAVIVTAMAAAEPRLFFENIHQAVKDLTGVKLYCANPSRTYPCFIDDGIDGNLEIVPMFLTAAVSRFHGQGFVHYQPQHLSRWSKNILDRQEVDVFWGSCTPPDASGFVNLGVSNVYELEILSAAKRVILEVNDRMPHCAGSTSVPLSRVNAFVEGNGELPCVREKKPLPTDFVIGKSVSDLIGDGSTLQFGIGAIPNALGQCLTQRKNLGIHTEMINDTVMELVKSGAVDGSRKTHAAGKVIGSFVYGSRKLYDFVDRNLAVELHPASQVVNPQAFAACHKMISVNSAIEIDITGQVSSESIGHHQISGVGGAFETHYGAQLSKGGRGIIAMRSLANDDFTPKIVFELKVGSKISVSRNDIDTVVTEYGIAELKARSVRERIASLIRIAHPKTRDELRFLAKQAGYL
jgi:acyl-CoA hydrolase